MKTTLSLSSLRPFRVVVAACGLVLACACHPALATVNRPAPGPAVMTASWYGKEEQNGPTASGQKFNMYAYTAAHKTLPMGTILSVRNPANGKEVRVTVNDRGPYVRHRDIDLSYAAARDLGILTSGVARLYVSQVGYNDDYAHYWKHGTPEETASAPARSSTLIGSIEKPSFRSRL